MDYQKEVETFRSKLQEAREKFNHWTGDELRQLTQDLALTSSKLLQDSLEEKKDHEDGLNDLRHKCQVSKRALNEHIAKLQELKTELKRLNEESDERLKEHRFVEQDLLSVGEDISREKQLLSAQEKAISEKLTELERAAAMFQDRLGLKFKKTSGGRLQVVFTCVDDKDPDARFYFYVQINQGKYIVSGCEPLVDNFEALVKKLNSTNNFRSFVIAVRKAFKATIKS
ncbi:kinetochore protein Spc25-like [Haliotis rufescens]|uniref:kinetochore protein Spc25-like n=1 Tax=Haliotis rufescens TaxID=6454 RepID=UPI001EB08608|nr:kinetochore protein Spc25-like [Haliotis rufescens]XP_046333424.1 kinetochore protein Spc25-like [Haliotis rufescens]